LHSVGITHTKVPITKIKSSKSLFKKFRLRYLIIGLLVAGLGLFTSSIPYSQNLVTLYCLGFFSGFCGGALDAGLIFVSTNKLFLRGG